MILRTGIRLNSDSKLLVSFVDHLCIQGIISGHSDTHKMSRWSLMHTESIHRTLFVYWDADAGRLSYRYVTGYLNIQSFKISHVLQVQRNPP